MFLLYSSFYLSDEPDGWIVVIVVFVWLRWHRRVPLTRDQPLDSLHGPRIRL